MTQSRLESAIEVGLNIGSGLLIAALIVQPLVFPLFDIETTTSDNIIIAILFTTVSIVRGYIWRRLFANGSLHRAVHRTVTASKNLSRKVTTVFK